MAGMGSNYYAALGLEVARNDGSEYSKAASTSLSNAADSLHNIFDNTNKAFEQGKTDITNLGNILGTSSTINSPATGFMALSEQLTREEKIRNEEVAYRDAKNKIYELEIAPKVQSLHDSLGKINAEITNNDSINKTGLTQEQLSGFLNEELERKYLTNRDNSKDNRDIAGLSEVPFTTEYIKQMALNPNQYQLSKDSMTQAQRETIESIMGNRDFLNAIQQEKAIKQAEADRANGNFSNSQLLDIAQSLKLYNDSITETTTTQDIYDMLVQQRDAKMGRKAGETIEEFNFRKQQAQTALESILFGISDRSKAINNTNSSSNGTNGSSGSSSSSKSGSKTTQQNAMNVVTKKPIDEKDLGKGLVDLGITAEDDLSPTNLLSKVGDTNAKGELTRDKENNVVGINDIMGEEKIFKAQDNYSDPNYAKKNTVTNTFEIIKMPNTDSNTLINAYNANLKLLTPEGQELYREKIINNEAELIKSKKKFNFSKWMESRAYEAEEMGGTESGEKARHIIKELPNIIKRLENGTITIDDYELIKSIPDNYFSNIDNQKLLTTLKDYMEGQKIFNSSLNSKEQSYGIFEKNKESLNAQINNLKNQEKVLNDKINVEKDEKRKAEFITQKEQIVEEKDKLINNRNTLEIRENSVIVGNNPTDKVSSTVEEFNKDIGSGILAQALNQDEFITENGQTINSASREEYFGNSNSRSMAYLAYVLTQSLDMSKKDTYQFIKAVLQDEKVKKAFAEYEIEATKAAAKNEGKNLTKEILDSDSGIKDLKTSLMKRLNSLLLDKDYAQLEPKYGNKYKFTTKNPQVLIQAFGRLVTAAKIKNPKNAKDVLDVLKQTR